MDALQWMGAVRMRAQTADKNITIIHTTPVQQLMSCDVKSCIFVRNKIITETFLTLIWIYIDFYSEKIISSESGKQYAQIKNCLQAKTVLNKYVGGFWGERTSILWHYYGMDLYFVQKWRFKVKTSYWYICFIQIHIFSLHKTLTDGLIDVNWLTGVVWITCGLLWCFYQLFGLSFWRHPFTAEDPLMSKWCIAKFF